MENIQEIENNDVVRLLKEELEVRKKRNPRYSLRAFSQSLNISPAHVSQLISGKRKLTPQILSQISKALNLSPEEERSLHTQVLIPQYLQPGQEVGKRQLKEDEFRVISDWYHFAILSLCKIKNSKADPFWISERLGISVAEAREALERLVRLNILENSQFLKRKSAPLNVISETPSRAIQAYHNKILNMALDKLSTVPVEKRDYSAMTFLADPQKIQPARKMVEEFQDRLADFLQTPNAKEVFIVACQIFPLERIEK